MCNSQSSKAFELAAVHVQDQLLQITINNLQTVCMVILTDKYDMWSVTHISYKLENFFNVNQKQL